MFILQSQGALFILAGFSGKTYAAVLGTVSGVVISGAAAWIFGKAAGISGYNVSNMESLVSIANITNIKKCGDHTDCSVDFLLRRGFNKAFKQERIMYYALPFPDMQPNSHSPYRSLSQYSPL